MQTLNSIPVRIEQQFCGPPDSGNGGYVCGVVARHISGAATITLRKPIPLETELELNITSDQVFLNRRDELIAEGKPSVLDLEIPEPPSYELAESHRQNYIQFRPEYFRTCFVCGPDRKPADGLRIFAAPKSGSDLVATPWETFPGLFNEEGVLDYPFYHAALDCPGAFALMNLTQKQMLLGRMTAEVVANIHPAERLIVIGWHIGKDGRKVYSGTAIFNDSGALKAAARSVWIEL